MKNEKKAGKHRMNKNTLSQILQQYFQDNPDRTVSFKEIFKELRLNTHPLKMLAIEIMEEMAWDDFISRVSDNSYRLRASDTQILEGTFMRKSNGRNCVQLEGLDKPILVSERNSLYAMDGDRVRITLMARRSKHAKEAQVVEIVERAKDVFVGRLIVDDDMSFLITNEREMVSDILIPRKKLQGGRTNDRAVVKVLRWPDGQNKYLIGEVIDILGRCGENDAEMNTILVEYGLPYRYPQEVEDAANEISAEITPQDYAEREDYRDVFTCTIDPADAKDFDDALSIRVIEKNNSPTLHSPLRGDGGVYEVGVHIADVSHYVTEGSIIDQEAQKRATSIYLVDRTIPMLPERLCNNICSLRPDEEKLAYSVIFTMNSQAEVLDYRITHTVIKSNRRYVYDEVQKVIEGSDTEDPNRENLLKLWDIAKILREQRFSNGAVNFESEEMKFELDADGRPIRCYFKELHEANHLVEEFMLLANRTVAESVGKVKKGQKAKPLPYRIHDNPDPLRLESLKEFTVKLGYKMKSTSTKGETARALNQLMADVEGQREQKLIQMVALRSMQKARYSIHNIGHFGLAFDYYTHFTSPIRRYPDLLVHRLLTKYNSPTLNSSLLTLNSSHGEALEDLCKHSSAMEIVASNAERDSIKYKAVEFMQQHLGQVYDAHISGITSYGIFCEIDENHCEGMVPMRGLKYDYYDFDEKNYCLRGRKNHVVYRLGDPIRIQVDKANLEKKQLEFLLA